MTFREKHLWISVVTTVVVWGYYFWRLIAAARDGGLQDPRFGWVLGAFFIGCLIVSALVEMALRILAAATTRKAEREAMDERETLAALKASHLSLMALIAILFTVSVAAYIFGLGVGQVGRPQLDMADGVGLVLMSNALMAAVILSELIRYLFTLALLRRGH